MQITTKLVHKYSILLPVNTEPFQLEGTFKIQLLTQHCQVFTKHLPLPWEY